VAEGEHHDDDDDTSLLCKRSFASKEQPSIHVTDTNLIKATTKIK
jgi:hypothetical protein